MYSLFCMVMYTPWSISYAALGSGNTTQCLGSCGSQEHFAPVTSNLPWPGLSNSCSAYSHVLHTGLPDLSIMPEVGHWLSRYLFITCVYWVALLFPSFLGTHKRGLFTGMSKHNSKRDSQQTRAKMQTFASAQGIRKWTREGGREGYENNQTKVASFSTGDEKN